MTQYGILAAPAPWLKFSRIRNQWRRYSHMSCNSAWKSLRSLLDLLAKTCQRRAKDYVPHLRWWFKMIDILQGVGSISYPWLGYTMLYLVTRGIFQEKLKMIFEGNAAVSPTVWCSGMLEPSGTCSTWGVAVETCWTIGCDACAMRSFLVHDRCILSWLSCKVNFGQIDRLKELLISSEVAKHKDLSSGIMMHHALWISLDCWLTFFNGIKWYQVMFMVHWCFKKLAAMPAMWSPWAPCSQEIITQKSWLGQSWDGLMGGEDAVGRDRYPLVNVYITIENHHFQWENSL